VTAVVVFLLAWMTAVLLNTLLRHSEQSHVRRLG